MIGINKGALKAVNPNLKFELKFNYQTYTDLAGTVAATTNDYVRAWKSSVGEHLFTQSTDAARPQRVSDGLLFDGGDYVTLTAALFANNAAFTVEFWVYDAAISGYVCYFNMLPSDRLNIVGNTTNLFVGDGAANQISVAVTRPLNTWYHLALAYDGATYRLYRNGAQIATSTATMNAATMSSLQIGARTAQSQFTNGRMTDIRVYTACIYPSGTAFTPPTRSA